MANIVRLVKFVETRLDTIGALADLIQKGVVCYIGLSEASAASTRWVAPWFEVFQRITQIVVDSRLFLKIHNIQCFLLSCLLFSIAVIICFDVNFLKSLKISERLPMGVLNY